MIIRDAVLEDVPWLLEQLRAFDRFFGAKKSLVPSDPAAAFDVIASLVYQAKIGNGVFYVATNAGIYVGFIAGLLVRHPYNPDEILVLDELFWWVDPAHRGSSAGARLLAKYEEFGRAHGADWLKMTLEAASPVDPASLSRRGYRLQESAFLLELDVAREPALDLELPEMAVVAD